FDGRHGICWSGWCVEHDARHERGSIEPYQDLNIVDPDLLDQGSHELAKLEGSKRGPALRQLCRSVEHRSLSRGVKAERRDRGAHFFARREDARSQSSTSPSMSP